MRALYPGPNGICSDDFVEEENRKTRRKTLGARREPTTNSIQIW